VLLLWQSCQIIATRLNVSGCEASQFAVAATNQNIRLTGRQAVFAMVTIAVITRHSLTIAFYVSTARLIVLRSDIGRSHGELSRSQSLLEMR